MGLEAIELQVEFQIGSRRASICSSGRNRRRGRVLIQALNLVFKDSHQSLKVRDLFPKLKDQLLFFLKDHGVGSLDLLKKSLCRLANVSLGLLVLRGAQLGVGLELWGDDGLRARSLPLCWEGVIQNVVLAICELEF